MYLDDPQDTVFDVLGEAVFGDHPLGRVDHRPRAGDRRHARWTSSATSTRRATCRRGSSSRRPARSTTTRSWSWPRPPASTRARRAPTPLDGAPRDPAPQVRFQRKDTEQVHVCLGARRARPPRRPALRRAACWTRSSAGCPRRGCSRPCARSAGSPTASSRSPAQFSDTGQIGLYVGTRPDNLGQAMERRGGGAARACATEPGTGRGARPGQGERQGAHRAGPRVLLRAHEPPRRLDAVRPAAAGAGGADGAHRRRHARRPRRRWPPSCGRPSASPPPASAPTRTRSAARRRARRRGACVIRVAVAGAAGRMGQAVCARGRGGRRHGGLRPGRPGAGHDDRRRARRRRRRSSTSPSPTRPPPTPGRPRTRASTP